WPRIRIEEAAVTIRQQGRPEFQMNNLQLTAEWSEERYHLAGTIGDAKWGQWTVGGALDQGAKSGHAELATSDGPLDHELLRSIPYVPESTWQHVQTAGRTAATIRFEMGESFRYSVNLTPAGRADLVLPDLETPLTGVAGTIRIGGAKVTIDHCQGR